MEACKELRKKPPADKTWANFTTCFATEYHDLREQQRMNMTQAGFHNANLAMEQVDIMQALDNLAMVATSDHDFVAQLTKANTLLTEMDKPLTVQLLLQATITKTKT